MLRERLTRVLRGRITALRGLSGTTFLGVTILVVAAISVAVLVLLGSTAPPTAAARHPAPARSAAAISMTRLVADAKAGQLSNALVDESTLVVQATYGPGAPPPSAPPGPAADGGTLGRGAVANANVLKAYLPRLVDTLIAAGVPVHAGTIIGTAITAPVAAAAAAGAGAVAKTATTTSTASGATGGSFFWALCIGLLGLLAGSLVIALGSHWRKYRSQSCQ